jgi:hypothetical protein
LLFQRGDDFGANLGIIKAKAEAKSGKLKAETFLFDAGAGIKIK